MKMKRGKINFGIIIIAFILSLALTNACNLNVNLISQEPYPAIPGESIRVVFQVTGVTNKDCGEIQFIIKENFPFSVDPSMSSTKSLRSGIYIRDYPEFWLVPFILRISDQAKESTNILEVLTSVSGSTGGVLHSFDIEIKDVETDFEIHVRDYSKSKGTITFEVANVGKNDIESLSIEIPPQEDIEIRGNRRNTLGVLDSNEYTTTTFNAIVKKEKINLIVRYNDLTGTRRTLEKDVHFNASDFAFNNGKSKINSGTIIILLILIAGIIYFFYRKHKKRKFLKKLHK